MDWLSKSIKDRPELALAIKKLRGAHSITSTAPINAQAPPPSATSEPQHAMHQANATVTSSVLRNSGAKASTELPGNTRPEALCESAARSISVSHHGHRDGHSLAEGGTAEGASVQTEADHVAAATCVPAVESCGDQARGHAGVVEAASTIPKDNAVVAGTQCFQKDDAFLAGTLPKNMPYRRPPQDLSG